MNTKVSITIDIDTATLGKCGNQRLALLWHLAQANPAPHDDKTAGVVVEHIGREIIRRWLRGVEPELWHHQGRSYYWNWLIKFATYQPGGDGRGPLDNPDWDRGTWVPKAAAGVDATHDVEPHGGGGRCPAAHADDPSACEGPHDAVRLVAAGDEVTGCVRHIARMHAYIDASGAPVRLYPAGTPGAAVEAYRLSRERWPRTGVHPPGESPEPEPDPVT